MASPSTTYQPRQPAAGVLHQVVREHFETFLTQAADLRDGEGLPSFVEQEFRDFLRCGSLGGGFARFRCSGCGFDRLVPFSCRGRGFCPSCGGRRMAERAAHLVDHVFPRVPVRQWVLSLPHRLRYRLAWDHALCRAVVGRSMRAILGFLRRRAREDGVKDGRSGAVAIVQRFGGALNLNVHFHILAVDGVFVKEGEAVRFHPSPSLDAADVDDVLLTVESYVQRLLGGSGADASDEGDHTLDAWVDDAPVLAGLAAAASISMPGSACPQVKQILDSVMPDVRERLLRGEVSIHRAWQWRTLSVNGQRDALWEHLHHGAIKKTVGRLVKGRELPRLHRPDLGADPAPRRHRHRRQPRGPQGRRHPTRPPGRRGHTLVLATLQPGPQSHRALLREAQGPRSHRSRRWCADAGRPTRFKPSSPSPTDAVRDGSAKLGHPVQNVTREHGLTPLPR